MQIVDRLLAGDRRALARLISLVENGHPDGQEAMRLLHSKTGRAKTVGITGPAGTGKSTLVNQLAKEFRARGKTVGIVAVDPSSPFTRGAILGDRIRMQDLVGDPDIFIRSMATRGSLGGLAETTTEVMSVLDAFGKDVVIVETVGAGQDEVEVIRATQTVVVIGTPGFGDDVQVMKAGILEIADIFVVNKADKEGANTLVSELNRLLSLSPGDGWKVPVLKTVAPDAQGIPELVDAIEAHWNHLKDSGRLEKGEEERVRHNLLTLTRQKLIQRLLEHNQKNGQLDALVKAVVAREIDPHSAAERLIANGEKTC